MKKIGIMVVFLVFLTTGLPLAQEIDEGAVCQVYMGSSSTDGEIEVEFDDIDDRSRLVISVRNRIRNADVEITRVEVKGINSSRRTITETFRARDISFSNRFSGNILERSQRGSIRVRLGNIKTVLEVTVYADICEL
jgi:hypothetical protein